MPKLSDTQAVLLSTAAQREDGSLFPLPAQLRPGGGVAKAITALVGRGLVEERDTCDPTAANPADGDLRYGTFITAAGLQAIGIEPAVAVKPERRTKAGLVLAMLSRTEGATLTELVAVTDWLPKTIRAALTGLRKQGHAVERMKRDGATCYRIVVVAA